MYALAPLPAFMYSYTAPLPYLMYAYTAPLPSYIYAYIRPPAFRNVCIYGSSAFLHVRVQSLSYSAKACLSYIVRLTLHNCL